MSLGEDPGHQERGNVHHEHIDVTERSPGKGHWVRRGGGTILFHDLWDRNFATC